MTINNFSTVQVHVFRRFGLETEFLVLRRSDNEKLYPGVWQVITGTIENDETAWETAIREVYEETSIIPNQIWTLPVIASFYNPELNQILSSPVFAFEVNNDSKVVLSDEHSDFLWLKYNECRTKLVFPSHIQGLEVLKTYILNHDLSSTFVFNKDWQNVINRVMKKDRADYV